MRMNTPQRLGAGDRLPPLVLPAAPEGEPRDLRAPSRDALVLLLLPRRYDAWTGYLDGLARAAGEIEHWYARVRVVVAGGLEPATELHGQLRGRLTVLADAGQEAFRRMGMTPGGAALVIADRYGQIYEVVEAGAPGELPLAGEIEEWTKFLATQCPECGVIDEPGHGEWASA
jgi:hypothetical protein